MAASERVIYDARRWVASTSTETDQAFRASTIQTSGNVGLGIAPSGTAGQLVTAEADGNFQTVIRLTNTEATGTSAATLLIVTADTAMAAVRSNGSGVVTSRWGHAVGGYVEIMATAGNGLDLGTLTTKPLQLGTNATVGLAFDATNPHPSFPVSDKRVSTQFDATNNTTLANVTGLSIALTAGKTYAVEAWLDTSSANPGGIKMCFAGTATLTAMAVQALVFDAGVLISQTRATALTVVFANSVTVTGALVLVRGFVTCNAAGTLTVQFAQSFSTVAPSSVLVGSFLRVVQMA